MRAMRPTSSVRAVASITARVSSPRIIRSMSRRCRTMTSLAAVTTGVRKGIVDAALRAQLCGEQGRETQKCALTQMGVLHDLHVGGIRRQHPQRDLQSSLRRVDHTDRAVSQFWSTDDAKTQAMKRVEWVEDSDVRGVCAQGIEGVGAIIPTSTAWCRRADCRPITRAGFIPRTRASSSR